MIRRRTAAVCTKNTCEGCPIRERLLCIHTVRDLFDFAVLALSWFIPFLAGMLMGRHWTGLVVWLGLAVVFFGYVEALILCRHCPHYAERGCFLHCHANWGLPKIPGYEPRPMTKLEWSIWLAYVAVLFLYHIPFFIAGHQWLLLAITTWAALMAAWTTWRTQCSRCYNFACRLNRVPKEVREEFFKNCPEYARAWNKNE